MIISKTNLEVRYVETDKMGIVDNSNYYDYFALGRRNHIKSTGLSYLEIKNLGILLPLIESQCKYIAVAKFDDNLIIETCIKKLTGARIVYNYTVIRKNDNKIIATGKTAHAFVDNNFKILKLKKKNHELWNSMST